MQIFANNPLSKAPATDTETGFRPSHRPVSVAAIWCMLAVVLPSKRSPGRRASLTSAAKNRRIPFWFLHCNPAARSSCSLTTPTVPLVKAGTANLESETSVARSGAEKADLRCKWRVVSVCHWKR